MPEGKAVVMPDAPFDYVTMKMPPVPDTDLHPTFQCSHVAAAKYRTR